jgi:hypothetical protein
MKFLGLSLIALLAVPLCAAPPVTGADAAPCVQCLNGCDAGGAGTRVVPVHVYNQSRLNASMFTSLIDAANRVWAPYAIRLERHAADNAIAVVITERPNLVQRADHRVVLGDTIFNDGHATPYMHLWLSTAEDVAIRSIVRGKPFSALPEPDRDAVLIQMLGVALAHELGHYLLDTRVHTPDGLLRTALKMDDLARPNPARLRLTPEQQAVICSAAPRPPAPASGD